jgi:excisionase family DNA binding protein
MDGQQEMHFTVAELALRWNYHERTVRRAIAARRIPGAWKLGHEWRVPAWAIARIESGQHSQAQPTRR